METTWLVSFLLLLSVQALPSYSLQGLSCINSLIDSITCNWTSSEISPEVHCVLQGVLKRNFKRSKCDLKPMEGQDHTLRSCQLVLTGFSRVDCVSIDVKCGNSVVASVDYNIAENVKMNPPVQPIINNFNVSWSFGSPHSSLIDYGDFELQFKLSDQPWQNAETHLVVGQMSVELQNKLEVGRSYQARVRVMPGEEEGLQGVWSSWSPIASWKSEVGKSPSKGLGTELWITLGLVATVAVFLLLISCRNCRGGWVYKLKFPHVSNPSTYFEAMNSVHGGNFQKWLSPLFGPESFDVTQHFEDISPVVIFKADDITSPLYKEHLKDPAEQWESSSKNPSSCSMEVCPEYFSYKLGVGHTQEEGGFVGVKLEDVPLQTSCSHEQLGDLHGESQHPDPGCGKRNEDHETGKEEEGESKDVDGPREMDCVPLPTVLSVSLSGQLSPPSIPLPPHLPSFPQLPLPFHVFDSGTVPGSHVTSGPLERALTKSSFAEIKPSSGGYMSVQNAHVNNSI